MGHPLLGFELAGHTGDELCAGQAVDDKAQRIKHQASAAYSTGLCRPP
jgi:hypothetical protein